MGIISISQIKYVLYITKLTFNNNYCFLWWIHIVTNFYHLNENFITIIFQLKLVIEIQHNEICITQESMLIKIAVIRQIYKPCSSLRFKKIVLNSYLLSFFTVINMILSNQ